MRLIDADAMNEELFYKQLGGKDTLITAESAFNMIKAQPTAYDIEKVVKELDEVWFQVEQLVDEDGYKYKVVKVVELDTAIDIVRKGGMK